MNKIQFTAHLSGKHRNVEITDVAGSGGLWHLYIDGYYYGQFSIYQGDWVFRPQSPENFTPETVEMLLNKLREHHRRG